MTTDFYGNIYVASYGGVSQGRIDIFDPAGFFITELKDPAGPLSLAVDSQGTLYVGNDQEGEKLVRYVPTIYNGAAGEIEYGTGPSTLIENEFATLIALSVNRLNDHLFANLGTKIKEYASAAEGNAVVDPSVGEVFDSQGYGLAVDATHGRIYATHFETESQQPVIRVFELGAPHNLLLTIKGSAVPAGKFLAPLSVTVDEGSGHIFIYDQEANRVYELTDDGKYVGTIEHGFQFTASSQLSVDNGPFSPNGGENENGRYLFVPSHRSGVGHVFAFGPAPKECAPSVDAVDVAAITEAEAELQATINPCNLPTSYTFEYTSAQSFEGGGSVVVGSGTLPGGSVDLSVATVAHGLLPDTQYLFRVTATNKEGVSKAEGAFRTYPAPPTGACPNDALRTGFSAALPDCRAFELVSPAVTNGRSPRISNFGTYFPFQPAAPSGDKVSFQIEGGSIPGSGASGWYAGDPYLASRGPAGWTSSYTGPTPLESPELVPGATSPDQGYSFWSTAGGKGTAAVEEGQADYVRYPDGHSELIGRGSLGTDPLAVGKLISEGGGHIIFATGVINGSDPIQLERNAPPTGTRAIYDRTPDEVTHVVSLLPGNETPKAGEHALYEGASLDGRGVAFSIGGMLYLRYENEATFAVGEGVTFAGVAEGGGRIFYVKEGKLLRFDAVTGQTTAFNSSGTAIPVNVSADGGAAYFISTSVLTSKANPNGAKAQAGQENLYLSKEGAISFVGTVTERDVVGEPGNVPFDGLGLWSQAVSEGLAATDPSRVTPDGSVLLFQSRAALTGTSTEGSVQVYRYDAATSTLGCISCNPTGAAANGQSSLQSLSLVLADPEPLNPYAAAHNLRSDGKRAFFQSTEPLVASDTDQMQDVYEWEDQGVGSCVRAGGCVYLISSGHSRRVDYLYGVSDSGDDVFFTTADQLVPVDAEETPSIYDARVGGGFPEARGSTCEGEGCHLPLPATPELSSPRTAPAGPRHHCRKGQRKIRRHGEVRCIKKHHRHHRHKRTATKGASK